MQDLSFVFIHIDKVFIVGNNKHEYCDYLLQVFERYGNYGPQVNTSKCVLVSKSIEILPHLYTAEETNFVL